MAKHYLGFTADELDILLSSINRKAGYFFYDTTNNRYLVFTDEEAKDKYLDNPIDNNGLIIGAFDAPFNYTAEINLVSDSYNAVFFGSIGNTVSFNFDVKNKQGVSTGENVLITYTITRGSVKHVVKETRRFGDTVVFNVDKYLSEGTNTIVIGIVGQTTLAATTAVVTYQVVDLSLTDTYDISKSYNASKGPIEIEVPYTVKGIGSKIIEWYVDGVLQDYSQSEDYITEPQLNRIKKLNLSGLSHGRHSLQYRAYIEVNSERFYSDTLYRDFFVYNVSQGDLMIGISMTIPAEYEVFGNGDTPVLYDMVQYVPYTLTLASFSPSSIAGSPISVYLDDELKGSFTTSNDNVYSITLSTSTYGDKVLKIVSDSVSYEIPTKVQKSSLDIEEITNALAFDFNAQGRSNASDDRDSWSYGDYIGTLTGFKWNATSGWVNGRLEMSDGETFSVNYAPLSNHNNGKTIELEWMTKKVVNDDAVICDLRNENGAGLLITATSVSLTSRNGVEILTQYKSEENVRVGVVIHPATSNTEKMAYIYSNGVLSRAVNIAAVDNYNSNKSLSFTATADASVSLKAIRVYDAALNSNQMLNNYMLYRDTVEEMLDIYERNDVYDGIYLDTAKMSSRLPVMIVTGDVDILEATSDKDTQIQVDIEYINMQDTSRSFTLTKAAMRPQGTSSMDYPKKNFRIYTRKYEETVLRDADGNIVEDKLYSFKDNAIPVDCWCLKADYAESSGTHNTGIARLWNKALYDAKVTVNLGEGNEHNVSEANVLRTQAQQKALDNGYEYDVRTAIDGFPILMFYHKNANDPLIFIGKYNFNNDKSTENVFGFTDIPGFDNSRMQCWEVLNNGNSIGLFTDISKFYETETTAEGTKLGWELAFESRYPDTKSPNTNDLYNFAVWMNGINGDHDRFATEKWEHFDVYKMAAYYCYLMRHAGADQFVKNSMFTSEDGEHFYFILYDNDTINGLNNDGLIEILPTDNRQSKYATGAYKFAGHDSVLWNMLEADQEFIAIVSNVDSALAQAGITYKNVIKMFDEEQADKWVERVYNLDAEYKYINPFTSDSVNQLGKLQGKRDLHRRWWLANRFALYDSILVSGDYKSNTIEVKPIDGTLAGQVFTVTSGYPIHYGYGINNLLRERTDAVVDIDDTAQFETKDNLLLGDPIDIYGAPYIKALDLSQMMDRIQSLDISGAYTEALGTRLETLIVGSKDKTNITMTTISGLANAQNLAELNVENMTKMSSLNLTSQKYLKVFKSKGSGLGSVTFAEGAPIERIELPSATISLSLSQLPYLNADNLEIESKANIYSVSVHSCPSISSDYSLIKEWMQVKTTPDSETELYMDNVNWSGVSGAELARIAQFKNVSLKGKIVLTDVTPEQGELFERFGDNVFNEKSDLYIDAPVTVTIYGSDSVLEGNAEVYSTGIFPNVEGTITMSLEGTRDGVSFEPTTGELTTIENGLDTSDISIKAVFTGADGEVSESTKVVSIVKRVYPSGLTISGDGNIKTNTRFTWSSSTPDADITGNYYVEWAISGGLSSYYSVQNYGSYCELHQDLTPPTNMTGTLSVVLKKVVDDSVVASATKNISFSYVYPSVVTVSGKTTVQGGVSDEYIAVVTPSNVDIGVTYTWSVSGSSNVFVESSNGATCVLGSNVPDQEEAFTLTCTVKSIDNKASVSGSLNGTLQTRPNFITATYKTTTDNKNTMITSYALTGAVSYMEVDGVEVTPSSYYIFPKAGTHIVKLAAKRMYRLFYGVEDMISVDFSESNGLLFDSFEQTFSGCTKLTSIYWGDCEFKRVTDLNSTFFGCSSLTSIDLTPFADAPITSMSSAFSGCSSLTSIDLTLFTGAQITNLGSAFEGCSSLISIDLTPFTGAQITTLSYTFNGCKKLTSIDLTPFADAPITSMRSAFSGCSSLTSIDLTPFAGAQIADLNSTFFGCSSLTSIDLTPFAGAQITNLGSAFNGCSSLTSIDLTPFTGAQITTLDSTFSRCSSLTSIDLTPFTGAPIKNLGSTFNNCSSLTSIDLTPFTGAQITTLNGAFGYCSSLTSIDLTPLSGAPITSLEYTFSNCSKLTSIDLSALNGCQMSLVSGAMYMCTNLTSVVLPEIQTSTRVSLGTMFQGCSKLTLIDFTPFSNVEVYSDNYSLAGCVELQTIIMPWTTAPTINYRFFGTQGYDTQAWTGYNKRNGGGNTLIIPLGATGYDTGAWIDPLQVSYRCGFTIKSSYEPSECTSLTIIADDVIGNDTNTTIYWTAITNGVDSLTGEYITGVELTGTVTSEEFPQNTSETESALVEISFTYMGVTATTTIEQGVWVNKSYTLDLNSQWQQSSVANPDPTLYDGVYESFSNKGKDGTAAIMYIDILGYESFSLYIRSYAESVYDYVMVSQLDQAITNDTSYSNATLVKAHTRGNQKSGTAISDYTLVEFTGIDALKHRITIVYRKDSSSASGDDRGYILIPKNQ